VGTAQVKMIKDELAFIRFDLTGEPLAIEVEFAVKA
jgi:GTP-dependent phosphoenolpyruvate carboxykinase